MYSDTKRESTKDKTMTVTTFDLSLAQIATILTFARSLEVDGVDPYIVLYFRRIVRIALSTQ